MMSYFQQKIIIWMFKTFGSTFLFDRACHQTYRDILELFSQKFYSRNLGFFAKSSALQLEVNYLFRRKEQQQN